MTEIPIVVSDDVVTVGGYTDKVELQLSVGATGERGSRIFTGSVNPNTLPSNDPIWGGYTDFKRGDIYLLRDTDLLEVWEYLWSGGEYVWVQTVDNIAGGGGSVTLDPDLDAIAALTGTGILKRTAPNTWALDTTSYLTANQTITLSGDASGSGTTSIVVTVADDSHSHTGSTISGLDAGDTTTGTFNIARIPTGTSESTVALGNHTHSYQPVDGDLTAIAAVSGTGYLRRTGVDTWTLDTPATATWGGITGTLSSQTDLQSALDGKQSADADLTAIAALAGTSGLLKKTAANTWTLDTATYLTANQTITLSGDASGSGTTAITVTVADDSHAHTSSTISALDAGDVTTGTFNIARIPTGTTGTTVALGNHTHSYQPVDGDLTAIAAISGTGYLRRTGVDTWTLDTPATATWGSITGTVSSQTDLYSEFVPQQMTSSPAVGVIGPASNYAEFRVRTNLSGGTNAIVNIMAGSTNSAYIALHDQTNDQRVWSIGKDANADQDFFIGRYSAGAWVEDAVVIDKPTGEVTVARNLAVGTSNTAGYIRIANSGSGNASAIEFHTGNSLATSARRWWVGKGQAAETGSNAGSDFYISSYNDSGSAIANAVTITRSNSNVALAGSLTVNSIAPSSGYLGLNYGGGGFDAVRTGQLQVLRDGVGDWNTLFAAYGTAAEVAADTPRFIVYGRGAFEATYEGKIYGAGSAYLKIDGGAGSERQVQFQTAGSRRWVFGTTSTAESGSNAGSNFSIARYSDAGAWIDNPIEITRSTGTTTIKSIWLASGGKIENLPTPSSSSEAANKGYVDTQLALKAPIASPTFTGVVSLSGVSTPVLKFENGVTLSAKNSSGTDEQFLWPRWTDNVMYLNYGAAGWSIRNSGSTVKIFIDNAGQTTFYNSIIAPAATTSIPSIRIPHGTAPTSPADGDVWSTTSGLYVRVNGVTIGPLASASGGATWGTITGTLSSQTDLNSALSAKAPTASPTFTGTVATDAAGTVNSFVAGNVGTIPSILDGSFVANRDSHAIIYLLPHGSSGIAARLCGYVAGGTAASRTVPTASSLLMSIDARGWGGTGYRGGAGIEFSLGTGTFSDTSMPGKIEFQTVPDGSVTRSTRLTIDQNGMSTFNGNVLVSGTNKLYLGTATGGFKGEIRSQSNYPVVLMPYDNSGNSLGSAEFYYSTGGNTWNSEVGFNAGGNIGGTNATTGTLSMTGSAGDALLQLVATGSSGNYAYNKLLTKYGQASQNELHTGLGSDGSWFVSQKTVNGSSVSRDNRLAITNAGVPYTTYTVSTSDASTTLVTKAYADANYTVFVQNTTNPYTFALSDAGKSIEMNASGATTFTIPLNSAVAFPVGTVITVWTAGTGQCTINGTAGVTINATPQGTANTAKLRTQWSSATLIKRFTDQWIVIGDLIA